MEKGRPGEEPFSIYPVDSDGKRIVSLGHGGLEWKDFVFQAGEDGGPGRAVNRLRIYFGGRSDGVHEVYGFKIQGPWSSDLMVDAQGCNFPFHMEFEDELYFKTAELRVGMTEELARELGLEEMAGEEWIERAESRYRVIEPCEACGRPIYGDYCPACYPAEDDQGPEEGIAERREGWKRGEA